MAADRKPVISPRKAPQQRRSSQLVADILEAAVRVLVREGAHRFTTARVAAMAGISVGSLYQYFPNKEAILFRLQSQEWRHTMDQLQRILAETDAAPLARLHRAVQVLFRSECEEAALRSALEEAAPLYREAPESHAHVEEGRALMMRFVQDALPRASPRERAFAADLIGTVMSAVGKTVSSQGRKIDEVDALADAVGEMFGAYLSARGA
ncbi:MAG: TetR family transcriptional regulator [Steroidobacteraceae bacterium]